MLEFMMESEKRREQQMDEVIEQLKQTSQMYERVLTQYLSTLVDLAKKM